MYIYNIHCGKEKDTSKRVLSIAPPAMDTLKWFTRICFDTNLRGFVTAPSFVKAETFRRFVVICSQTRIPSYSLARANSSVLAVIRKKCFWEISRDSHMYMYTNRLLRSPFYVSAKVLDISNHNTRCRKDIFIFNSNFYTNTRIVFLGIKVTKKRSVLITILSSPNQECYGPRSLNLV